MTGTDIEDSPELVQHGPLRLRIRAALRNGPLNTSELAKVTESSDAAVRAMLSRMTNEIAKAPGNSKVSIWQLKPQVGFDDVT